MNVFSYFKQKNDLKEKLNFLVKYHNIEYYSVFLGLSYIQYCKNINHSNLHNYTLGAILLANKYLNDHDHDYNIVDITTSIDLEIKEYIKIEIDILTNLNWNLSTLDSNVMNKYKKLIKSW
tara:strand:- start:349 stop:711 length:363 start_codon:yes stop_codon:yes gene_type:complete